MSVNRGRVAFVNKLTNRSSSTSWPSAPSRPPSCIRTQNQPVPRRCVSSSAKALDADHHNHHHHHSHGSPVGSASEAFGASDRPHQCWSCQALAPVGSFFCENCNVVLPPCGRCNYFQFFNSPETYRVDPQHLQLKYRDLQRTLHPDKFHRTSEREQRFSRDQSASLNTAYAVLQDPLLRAQYLLKLKGEDVLAEGKQLLDPERLSTFLEEREEVEDADSVEELSAIREKSKTKYEAIVAKLFKDFDDNDIEGAKRHTIELQYLSKLLEEVLNKLASLDQ